MAGGLCVCESDFPPSNSTQSDIYEKDYERMSYACQAFLGYGGVGQLLSPQNSEGIFVA